MAEAKSFAQKLFALRCGISKIKKCRTNPHFKSSYFDINDALAMLNPLLEENRLLLKQPVKGDKVYSIIQDIDPNDDGELEAEDSWINLAQNLTPQAAGSAITYARRYTLTSLLGLEADDDDGNATIAKKRPQQQQPSKKQARPQSAAHKAEREAEHAGELTTMVKPWLNLYDEKNNIVTEKYNEMVKYRDQKGLTKDEVLQKYRVNQRDMKYLNQAFGIS